MDSRDIFKEIVLRVLQCYDGRIISDCNECSLNGCIELGEEREDICEMIKEWTRENEI